MPNGVVLLQGVPGSPVREAGGEKQNNATATTTDDPRETHKLMAGQLASRGFEMV